MSSFQVPLVSINQNSWGPSSLPPTNDDFDDDAKDSYRSGVNKFQSLPYAPFGRSDRIGRAADFTSSGQHSWNTSGNVSSRSGAGGSSGSSYRRSGSSNRHTVENEEFQYKVDKDEQSSFQLVDTTRSAPKSRFAGHSMSRRRQAQQNRLRQLNARRSQQSGSGDKDRENARFHQPQRTRRRNQWNRGGRGGNRGFHSRVDRQASVAVRPDWEKVEEFDLSKLKKLRVDLAPEEEDLLWCGFLDEYNVSYDKVSTKFPTNLKRSETKEFYPVTTTDDPVIEKLAIDGTGNVFCTDAILAHLMTSHRSVYPWDIVIQKLPSGTLFFDKRDSSQFDYLTVNETANVPPLKNEEDPEDINNPDRLSLEATMINQNFSQQILKSVKTRKNLDLPNPFWDQMDNDGMEPASVAFRYRRFNFPKDQIQIVVRTELHGYLKKKPDSTTPTSTKDNLHYMTAFALNECPTVSHHSSNNHPSSSAAAAAAAVGMIHWRDKLDSQRGAVLATELKNNSCKLARWTAQSLLAGAHQMKIGFVSRQSAKNNYDHVILATQFYRPKDFATQITLNVTNMWGIVKMLIDIMKRMDQGKYVFMREPNRPVVKLYKVPINTFEEDEEDNEEQQIAQKQ